MRYLGCLILLIALLSGCSNQAVSLQQDLDTSLAEVSQSGITVKADNTKEFYSYYLEPSIGRRSSTEFSNLFVKDGQEFVMNLNAAQVVNDAYYQTVTTESMNFDSFTVLAKSTGEYVTTKNDQDTYEAIVFQNTNQSVIVSLTTHYFSFYGITNRVLASSLAQEMLKIARTTSVNEKAILSAYSSRKQINYRKESLDLFGENRPESGRVEELITDKTGPSNDNYDQSGDVFENGTATDNLPLVDEETTGDTIE